MAKASGFYQRKGSLSPAGFVSLMAFSQAQLENPTLCELCDRLLVDSGVKLTPQALDQRFNETGVAFLQSVLMALLEAQAPLGEAKSFFTAVHLKDSTKFKLPKGLREAYPNFGGGNSKGGASMNIQFEFDLLSGHWHKVMLCKATYNDQAESRDSVNEIVPGSLNLRDAGYITNNYLDGIERQKAYYINRMHKINLYWDYEGQRQKTCWKQVGKLVDKSPEGYLEIIGYLGKKEQRLCRVIIERVPDEVHRERVAKAKQGGKRNKNGYKISQEHIQKQVFNIFITNVPDQIMGAQQVLQAYRLRWQVELAFKAWKSVIKLHKTRSANPYRCECQLLGKLIWALVSDQLHAIANKITVSKGHQKACSRLKATTLFKNHACLLSKALRHKAGLFEWFEKYFIPIIERMSVQKKKGKQAHVEILHQCIPSQDIDYQEYVAVA